MSYKKNKKSHFYCPREGYNIFAKSYDDSLRYLDSFEKDSFYNMFDDLSGKRVLDVGCGTGRIIGELKRFGACVTGVDCSEKMLEITSKKFSDIETVFADIKDLPFEDNSFDAVFAMFVIVHLKDLQKAFDEVYRVLKDGGFFILSNINQRKAPKLKAKSGENIIIESHYHMPKHVIECLERSFFSIEEEKFVYEGKTWINQIIKAIK